MCVLEARIVGVFHSVTLIGFLEFLQTLILIGLVWFGLVWFGLVWFGFKSLCCVKMSAQFAVQSKESTSVSPNCKLHNKVSFIPYSPASLKN